MARVIGVHGIGSQLQSEELLHADWWRAMAGGLRRAREAGKECAELTENDLKIAFYGHLYRQPGEWLSVGDPRFTSADVAPGFEYELLMAWWRAAAETDPRVSPPDADTLVSTPRAAQTALRALSGSRFFAEVGLRAMVFDLKQVHQYLTDDEFRAEARERVADAIGPDTRVVVAHSLGSVVAYEALCSRPGHSVRAFVTIGSPLGIRNLIFDRLRPSPLRLNGSPLGIWPGGKLLSWTNLADGGDVVALVKDLRPAFGERVANGLVHNESHAHDAQAYLTERLCGEAIAAGLG